MEETIDDFRKEFPFLIIEATGANLFTVKVKPTTSYTKISLPLSPALRIAFAKANSERMVFHAIVAAYPNLYPGIDSDLQVRSLWVNRNGRDHESLDNSASGFSEEQLIVWNEEAGKALQDGWFFCSGHKRAEELKPGKWSYFAGNYCREYGIEHPDVLAMAKSERYD